MLVSMLSFPVLNMANISTQALLGKRGGGDGSCAELDVLPQVLLHDPDRSGYEVPDTDCTGAALSAAAARCRPPRGAPALPPLSRNNHARADELTATGPGGQDCLAGWCDCSSAAMVGLTVAPAF